MREAQRRVQQVIRRRVARVRLIHWKAAEAAQMMAEGNIRKCNNLEAELRAVETTLSLYRAALDAESKLAPKSC